MALIGIIIYFPLQNDKTPQLKEMVTYVESFQENADGFGTKPNAHPAEIVPHFLASPNDENTMLRLQQLEKWYMGYQQKRGSEVVYKSMNNFVRVSFNAM